MSKILGLVPTMQSLWLAGESYKMIPKEIKGKKPKRKKFKTQKMLKHTITGTTRLLVGIPLMKETAAQVKGL